MGFLNFQIIQKFEGADYPTVSFEDSAELWFTVLFLLYYKYTYLHSLEKDPDDDKAWSLGTNLLVFHFILFILSLAFSML